MLEVRFLLFNGKSRTRSGGRISRDNQEFPRERGRIPDSFHNPRGPTATVCAGSERFTGRSARATGEESVRPVVADLPRSLVRNHGAHGCAQERSSDGDWPRLCSGQEPSRGAASVDRPCSQEAARRRPKRKAPHRSRVPGAGWCAGTRCPHPLLPPRGQSHDGWRTRAGPKGWCGHRLGAEVGMKASDGTRFCPTPPALPLARPPAAEPLCLSVLGRATSSAPPVQAWRRCPMCRFEDPELLFPCRRARTGARASRRGEGRLPAMPGHPAVPGLDPRPPRGGGGLNEEKRRAVRKRSARGAPRRLASGRRPSTEPETDSEDADQMTEHAHPSDHPHGNRPGTLELVTTFQFRPVSPEHAASAADSATALRSLRGAHGPLRDRGDARHLGGRPGPAVGRHRPAQRRGRLQGVAQRGAARQTVAPPETGGPVRACNWATLAGSLLPPV